MHTRDVDRMAVSDLGVKYGWSRDRSSRQHLSPGPVAPRAHGPAIVQGRIVTGIAACELAEISTPAYQAASQQISGQSRLSATAYLLDTAAQTLRRLQGEPPAAE